MWATWEPALERVTRQFISKWGTIFSMYNERKLATFAALLPNTCSTKPSKLDWKRAGEHLTLTDVWKHSDTQVMKIYFRKSLIAGVRKYPTALSHTSGSANRIWPWNVMVKNCFCFWILTYNVKRGQNPSNRHSESAYWATSGWTPNKTDASY